VNKDQEASVPGHDTRVEEAETRTDEANTRTDEANTRTDEANTRTDEANTRTEEAEARSVEALRAGITERALAEEAAAQLAAIINSSNDAIIGKDLNSIVTSWNVGAKRMFGYSAKEMIGSPITRLIPSDRQQEEIEIINRIKQGESVEHYETLRMAKDGHLIDISVTVSPIKDKTGKIVGASKVARDITERKLAEKVLHRERDFISAVVDTVGSLVVVIDRQARIIRFNRACEKLTGYSFAEVQGRNLIDLLIMPAERETTTAEFLNLCAGQFPNTFENHWVTKQGNPRVIAWSNTALVDADGEVEYVIGTGSDITERKRTMESLVESEDRLRFVTDNARVGLVIVNRDRRYTYANNAYAEVLDLPESGIVGQRVSEVLPRIYEEQIRPQLDRAFAGERVAYELRKPESGGDRHFAIKYEPTKVEDEVTLVIVVVTDITEMKRAEEAQRATEARYRTLFDYAPIGIVIADTEGYWLDANASMCRMLGYAYDELIGLHASKIVATEDIQNIEPALSRVKAKLDHHRDGQFRRRDGSIFPTEIHATLMPDGNMVGMIQDISERKRAEQVIHDLNVSLERRVSERTSELESANKELEAFSYSVSHDLRAPLRAVDGFSQAVVEDYGPLLPEEGRRYLQTIREGAQRMGVLIDDLLTFSRLSRAALKKQEVNTDKLVRHVLEELDFQREGWQVEIRIGDLPACQGDPALLNQVWVNLLSNALKYTRQRSPAVVEIGCKLEQDENVYFVRDNGAGFDMRYAHKLFGVFQRLHRADEFEGTGVGLAIVQRVIHRHGGRIWADAAVDRGATFYFTLQEKTHL
jgi:PAS domain S-box-containing protein